MVASGRWIVGELLNNSNTPKSDKFELLYSKPYMFGWYFVVDESPLSEGSDDRSLEVGLLFFASNLNTLAAIWHNNEQWIY